MRRHKTWFAVLIGLAAVVIALGRCGNNMPEAANANEEIALPAPETTGTMSVEEAISKRRSVRSFQDRELSLAEVSQLAWAAQGITAPTRGLRAAPSAGALYPLELYLVKSDGAYHYVPAGHKLVKVASEDLRGSLCAAALGQSSVREAAMDVVIAAVFERTTGKYGERAAMYVHTEAGHVAENIHLQAVALGLGSVPIGAFNPQQISNLLALPTDQVPIYLIPVGYPR